MFHLGKTLQQQIRTFHATKPLFLFGSGVIKVNEEDLIGIASMI
jgi:hypothetical protein